VFELSRTDEVPDPDKKLMSWELDTFLERVEGRKYEEMWEEIKGF